MTPQALDPRKSPWKRGDVCTRDFKRVGFVLSYTSDYLEILWNGRGDIDRIDKVPAHEVDDILRVAHADQISPAGRRTNLENLEALEGLTAIENAIVKRTYKDDRERSDATNLIRRSFGRDGCSWDQKNAGRLLTLALEPENVGVIFKLRERLHRLFCSRSRKEQPSQRQGFVVENTPSAQQFDLSALRHDLAATQTDDVYKTELGPVLDRLEAKYGNNVPVAEIEGLQQLISSKLADIEKHRQEIISRGAREGKTIEIESLRLTLEANKAAYAGPDRNAYAMELDKLLESLAARYGSRIPIDHAYEIMQRLEAGLGYTLDE